MHGLNSIRHTSSPNHPMRTSKISRDTARVFRSLSPRNAQNAPVRRSLRNFAHTSDATTDPDEAAVKDEAEESSSSVSSPPSSPASSYGKSASSADETPSSSRKRKRGSDAPTATTSTPISSTSTSRTRRTAIKADPDGSTIPKKTRRQPVKHIKGANGSVKSEPPPNWEEVYNITAEMRKKVLAPVDTMGCESLADTTRSPKDQRLQTLVSLMLSSQTKDTVTAVAMRNLQTQLPGGFCLSSLLSVAPELLNELIAKVGFHNNKTKYIKATAEILRDRFDGDIPDTVEGLVSLPGVGPKMAYLCMSAAWGRDEGIGVDVHVHRITNLWGWHKTRNPEETRAELESWLPREKWHEINHLLVGFGQMICLPVGRRCGECVLSERGLCPSAAVPKVKREKVKREVLVKGEEEGPRVKVEVVEEEGVVLEKASSEAPGLDVPAQAVGGAEGDVVPDVKQESE
ncbi:alpha,alpha-trehalase nth1 [Zalaria obscura]|uniref:Alpha,alpha-trehalase nth1 n=1 Tax=Zalaria obscura TaxID=2024903 RepID=A0ACC3SIU5_9PEZI